EPEPRCGEDALGHLLNHHGAVKEIRTRAAVCFRDVGEEKAGLARLAPHLATDLPLSLPALVVGCDLALNEGGDSLAEELVLLLVDGARARHGVCSLGRYASGPAEPNQRRCAKLHLARALREEVHPS